VLREVGERAMRECGVCGPYSPQCSPGTVWARIRESSLAFSTTTSHRPRLRHAHQTQSRTLLGNVTGSLKKLRSERRAV
jgi:hypothetical protein